MAYSNRLDVENNVGAVDSIVNSDLEACPNHAMPGLDSRMVAWMLDEVVLSNRFHILWDNPDVCSDVDS